MLRERTSLLREQTLQPPQNCGNTTNNMNTIQNVQFGSGDQSTSSSITSAIIATMTALANRMESLLPDSMAASLRSRTALLSNLPYWGAILAAAFLVIAIVIRPCAQLGHIVLMHIWEYGISHWFWLPWGASNAVHTGSNSAMMAMMTSEEKMMGCNVGLAMATRALRYMDTTVCPVQTLEGKPCTALSLKTQNQQNQQQNVKRQTSLGAKDANGTYDNTTVCPSAALEFQGPTRRMIDWFLPFHQNGTVTCAHSSWFNLSSDVNGIVAKTMFDQPVVLWYPSVIQDSKIDRNGKNDKTDKSIDDDQPTEQVDPQTQQHHHQHRHHHRRRRDSRGQKLSLIVFSHLSQKEELLTYRSVVNISYLTPIAISSLPEVQATSKKDGGGNAEAVMVRKSIRLTGGIAHCVQWLLDAY